MFTFRILWEGLEIETDNGNETEMAEKFAETERQALDNPDAWQGHTVQMFDSSGGDMWERTF